MLHTSGKHDVYPISSQKSKKKNRDYNRTPVVRIRDIKEEEEEKTARAKVARLTLL